MGHPLVDRAPAPTKAAARESSASRPESRVLGLFPGSRAQEIRRLWAPFRDAALQLLREGRCDRVIVAGTPSGATYPDPGAAEIVRGRPGRGSWPRPTPRWRSRARRRWRPRWPARPMVVAYKVHPLTYRVFQRVRTVEWVSLVNLVGGPRGGAGAAAGPGARRPRWPRRCDRCSTRAIRAPSPSARDCRWSAGAWASRARRRGWWRSPASCWAREGQGPARGRRARLPRRRCGCWRAPGGSGRNTRSAGARCARRGGRTSFSCGTRCCCRCCGTIGGRTSPSW